jgi:hypothetical protein
MKVNLHLQKLVMLLMVAAAAFMTACYPDDDIAVSESDVIVTAKDDTVNFENIKTYYMPQRVFVVDDDTTDDQEPIEYENAILTSIAKNLDDYGYTRITDTTDAENTIDVVVIATAFETTVTSIWYPYYPYYPGWDDWYWWSPGWGYYPPGWGYYPPGYGYYPPYYPPYLSQYTMGTVKIDMIDPWKPDTIAPDTTMYPSYWTAAIHGLLQGDNIESRIERSIDQAFKQSPYLDHNR